MPTKTPVKQGKKPSRPVTKGKPASKTTPSKSGATKAATAKATTTKVVSTKSATKPTTAKPSKGTAKPTTKGQTKPSSRPAAPVFVPRAMPAIDDDDVLMAHGAGGGYGYGRCGGRMLVSKLEQTICDRLGQSGVAHSHSPRHFEVKLENGQVGAYAPMVVLRGRGREGKSVVVEAADEADNPILKKIIAFRAQYGQEFYVIFVAPDEVLDEVPLLAYDEACAAVNVNTLIARLAE
jgi:hypothetical protein